LSKHTSFIAVERRKEATIETMQTIDLNKNDGMDLSDSESSGSDYGISMDDDEEDEADDGGVISEEEMMSKIIPQSMDVFSQAAVMKEKESDKGSMGSYSMKEEKKKQSVAPAKKMYNRKSSNDAMPVESVAMSPAKAKPTAVPDASAEKNKADGNTVRAVLKQQEFTGAFSMATLKSIAKSVTADVVKKFGAEHKLSETAVVTLFVTVLFELKFAAQKTVWVLVMNKSKQWIKKESSVADLTSLETAAKTLLQPLL
jgi:hypothetical protein